MEKLKEDIKSIKELRKRKNEKTFRDLGSGFISNCGSILLTQCAQKHS